MHVKQCTSTHLPLRHTRVCPGREIYRVTQYTYVAHKNLLIITKALTHITRYQLSPDKELFLQDRLEDDESDAL